MTIDYYNKPEETLEELLDKYSLNTFLIVEDILSDKKGYKLVLQQMIDIMKLAFEVTEVRRRPIHYKFHANEKEIRVMPLNNFISNLVLWYAFLEMDQAEAVNETFIFDFSKPNVIAGVVDYLDNKVFPLFEGDFYSKNKICDEIFHNIRAIANAFCLLMGMSISMYDIWQTEKANPEISEIIFGSVDASLQPVEIEKELERRAERLIELFSQTDCDMKPLLISGKNISKGQFKEMFVKIGLKSDIQGNTIPLLMDTNLVVGGLNKPSYQYIEAGSARKSLIMTKQKMGYWLAHTKFLVLLKNLTCIKYGNQ